MSSSDQDLASQSAYLYSTWHVLSWLDLSLAIDYSHIESEQVELPPFIDSSRTNSRWNPKIGASVYLTPDTTFRAAYFEGLRKSALEDTGSIIKY